MFGFGKKTRTPACSILRVIRTHTRLLIYCECEKSLHTYVFPAKVADEADHTTLNER